MNDMKPTIIKNIPFDIRPEQLYPNLKIQTGSRYADQLDKLLESALDIASPKAVYTLSTVEHKDDSTLIIDGIHMKSRVMQVNLRHCRRVFPFVATCGIELEEWSQSIEDTLKSFWADTINMLALAAALEAFKAHIDERFEPGTTSMMNPGSLEDWPLSEQHKIFSLLGNACDSIGVRLTGNTLMIPLKSISGLEFESGEKFYNCRLCPREKCPLRRSSYDKHLYAEKYQPHSNHRET
ncbi:MAG: vitamin B12 dependent methionine synthase [Deltaproteobacteria bacterium]|nr:vitamin B12 dependent methionine synthase [Deltaproteobacteria bacterium]